MTPLPVVKAHAYGNDFLLVEARYDGQAGDLARALCHRHEGVGADGLILYRSGPRSAEMQLLNADGSPSELSGNGLRCLAALVARQQQLTAGAILSIATDAGTKTLELLERGGERWTFRAAIGAPEDIRQATIDVADERIAATVLRVGNPQCVVIGALPDAARFNRVAPALAVHPMFEQGTNVEFAQVEAPDRVRILIWERGVGPTTSSGTGSCASAVAAAAHGGAARAVDVIAPGGTQHVEWRDEGVYLTGWAEVVFDGNSLVYPA